MRRILRNVWRVVKYTLGLLLFLFLMQRSTYPLWMDWNAVSAIVREHQFDYVTWELNALGAKAAQTLWGAHPYMTEADRSQFVRDYMADLTEARRLENEISALYTDPNVADPDTASAERRAERDALRADLAGRQTLAESILEGQVATILVEQGFGTLGQLLPPISMRFTQMPNLLVVSPRDEIARTVELAIDPLPLEDVVALEERIIAERDLAPLVIPLGGMALFPAMIQETTNLPWSIETFAHEWVHHYFFFFPLGQNYFNNAIGREALIINETTADIFGKEIYQQVIARYYPEFAVADEAETVFVSNRAQDAPVFDFGRTMHVTRVVVDKYLTEINAIQAKADLLETHGLSDRAETYDDTADERITQMESYMETRRQLFYENGYRIRKLNQAYFAFYGGYQAGDRPGVGGNDPIGPTVREIRELSPSLHDFIVTMRGVTSREELLAVREAMEQS